MIVFSAACQQCCKDVSSAKYKTTITVVPATPDVDIGEVCSNLTSAPQLVKSLTPIRQSFCPNLPICAPKVWLQTGKWVQLEGFGCLRRRRGEERDEQDRDMKWT